MAVSLTERIGGQFLDHGGALYNLRHPAFGIRGDGTGDDSSVLDRLEPGHYLLPAGRYRIAANATIAAGTVIVAAQGADIAVDRGRRLTIAGELQAGRYRVFSGEGVIRFTGTARRYVLAQWWGARGDGRSDDTAAIRSALEASPALFLPSGGYRVTGTIDLGHTRQVRGESGALYSDARTTISASVDDLGEGAPIFRFNPGKNTDVSDVLVEGIHFRGDNQSLHFRRLSEGRDEGVVGIDPTHTKDHIVIRDCSFRGLKRGIGERRRRDYTGQVYIHNCHFASCYRAIELHTTTPLSIIQSDIRECADWVDAHRLSVHNSAFQNSSFATKFSGVRISGVGFISGCWFEGGNHQIQMTGGDGNDVTLIGNHFGACKSDKPSTKYTTFLAPGRFTALGNVVASSTRFINFADGKDYSRYIVRLINNQIPVLTWKYTSYDPVELGFDYVGDEAFDALRRLKAVSLGEIGGAAKPARRVRIGRIDGNYSYRVEISGAAANGDEPRVITRHTLIAQPKSRSIVVSAEHDDRLGTSVKFAADKGSGECHVTISATARRPLQHTSVRVSALNQAPVLGVEAA